MKLTYQDLTLQLAEPFVSNKGSVANVRQILVSLHWQGRIGIGTAVFYGMVAQTVRTALEICARLMIDASPFEIEQVLDRLEQAVPDRPMAISAIDMALHDLLGQIAGLPLHHLWGLSGLPLPPTGLSLGALPEAELLARSMQLAQWPILKLKLTSKSDIHAVGRLRNVYAGRIWIDGNGSWSVREAISAANTFHAYGVELLEQPIPAGTPELLRLVQEHSPIPIVADEDCMTAQDIVKLQGCTSTINIKLLKCGGLRRALEMIRLAHRLGFKVMLGCKTESSLGITAIAHLAGLADYLDLDGHLDLIDDPYSGIKCCAGTITLPEGSGLGITLRRGGLR
jgi:L-Ala-D/L-Glu epimerase